MIGVALYDLLFNKYSGSGGVSGIGTGTPMGFLLLFTNEVGSTPPPSTAGQISGGFLMLLTKGS